MRLNTIVLTGLLGVVGAGALPGCIFVSKTERSGKAYARNELATQIEPGQSFPGVRERRRDDLAKLNPGIGLDEFRKAFPDAIFVESRVNGAQQWHAYSVTHEELCQLNGSTDTFSHKDEMWFFFQDGQYRGFGKAKNWPTDAKAPE